MRSSHKARSRNKNSNNNNNRRSNPTNVVNRVFDSSGPEGKVRGTPQQIIDKYKSLASDAVLAGDRVNAENFLQHSEHYSRMLLEAQREINEKREAQEAQRALQQQNQQNQQKQQQQQQQKQAVEAGDAQPDVAGNAADLFPAQSENVNLVETPESKSAPEQAIKPAEKVELAAPEAEPKRVKKAPKPKKPAKAEKPAQPEEDAAKPQDAGSPEEAAE